MLIIPFLSSVLVLALVMYESQNVLKAIYFAVDWPANTRVSNAGGKLTSHTAPLTLRSRVVMGLYRLAYCSLVLHEVHCWRVGQPAVFKTSPSIGFGALIAIGMMLTGVAPESALALAMCAASVLFCSSQARALVAFYALRAETDKQLKAMFTSH
jgi:hypothetical protein